MSSSAASRRHVCLEYQSTAYDSSKEEAPLAPLPTSSSCCASSGPCVCSPRAPSHAVTPTPTRDEADDECDKARDECGVFGIYTSQRNASRVTFFALYALNHRGQESAGIASMDDLGMHVHKGMGLVSQVFTEHDIDTLRGSIAVGHTRYSTKGGSKLSAAQPFVLECDLGQLAIAHNGQVACASALRSLLLSRGTGLFTNSDTELIAQMLARPHDPADAAALLAASKTSSSSAPARSRGVSAADAGEAAAAGMIVTDTARATPSWPAWVARISAFMRDCEGAYSLALLTREALYGVRDPYGLRPLCIGNLVEADGSTTWHLASESCALATIGASYVREVHPGECVRIDDSGVHSYMPTRVARRTPAFCVFEYIYFARPDSILEGQMVHSVRTRLGRQLAREAPCITADIVSGVPDSSIAAAIGFAEEAALPFSEVFCKNRYIGRTFIKPDDNLRKNAIQLKYNPLTHILAGKSVVLVDDSLVRGNTLAQLVPLLRRGGAREVHVRISSPPIRHPCYMGVDIGTYDELVAHTLTDVEAIRASIGADTLAYLSQEGMMSSVKEGARRETDAPIGHCSACFTGEYPLKHDDAF